MFPVLAAMLFGMCVALLLRGRAEILKSLMPAADTAVLWVVRLLLFMLGWDIGSNTELLSQIPEAGLKGFILAAAGIAGSAAAAGILMKGFDASAAGQESGSGESGGVESGRQLSGRKVFKDSAAAVTALVLGLLFGRFLPISSAGNFDLSAPVLYLLMFLAGFVSAADASVLPMIRRFGMRLFLLPLAVVLGTLAGSLAAALLWKALPLRESLAVGAGFGYYSLSSLILRELSGEYWASVALISNLSREVITLLASPLLVRLAGPAAPAAAGGATSMDTTLGVTVQSAGREWAVPSLFSGMVLTLLVPFAVSFIMQI